MKRLLQTVVFLTLLFVATPLVKAGNPFPVLATQTTSLCPGGSGGTINLTPTGGTPSYSYIWNDGSTAQNRSNLASGNYAVTITDHTGLIDTFSFTINNPASFHITKSIVDEICGGQSIGAVTLNITGGTVPYTFSWNNGDTTQNLANLTAMVYYITITDANECTAVDSANVTQPPGVGISAAITDASCGANNGTIDLTIQYGSPGYTYLWNNGDTSADIAGLAAGPYEVTVTDSMHCTATATEVVPQLPGSMSINSTATPPSCYGGNNGSINITSVVGSTGPFSYLWNDSTTSQNKTGLAAGSYSVTVISGTGCTVSSSFNLSQPSAINITLTPIVLTCYGSANGAINTSVSGGTSPWHFNWGAGITTQNRTGLPSGTYTVTVTDNKSCTDTASVFVAQPTPVTVNVTFTNITCAGGPTGSVTANPSGGDSSYSYWWGAGVITQTKSNINAGTYTVTVTDGNGCTASASGTIPAYTPVNLSSSQVNNTCYGTDEGSINITANNGWGPFSYIWNTGDSTASIDSLIAGTYTVTVTDNRSCTASKSVTITQASFPITVNSTISDVTCYGDSTGGIIITPINGHPPYTYLWADGSTFKTLSNLPAGSYSLTVTDNSGCTAGMTFNVTQPQPIAITHTDNNVSCFGSNTGSIQLSGTGGYAPFSYSWSDGGAGQNRLNLAAGTYIVTVTDNYGCIAKDTSLISQPVKILIDTAVTNVACYGGNTGAVNLIIGGGVNPYTYNWGGGITTPSRTALNAGTYHVTVTDSVGCTATQSAIVAQPGSAINIVPAINNASCSGGNNGAINLGVSGGTVPYSFNWGGGVVSQNLTNLSAGTYMVTVTDTAGCIAADTITVSQATTLNVIASVINAACNGAADGAINITVTGGSPNYTFNWGGGDTTQNRANLAAGNYAVTVTDQAGCAVVNNSTITQSGSINIVSAVTNVSCYGGNTGAINITVTGGIAPYAYNWGGGITGPNRTGLDTGNYTVMVTDSAGCTLSSTSSVTQPAQLSLSSAANNVSCYGGNDGGINLTVSGGTGAYSFDWGGGITFKNRANLSAGSYTVVVTDSNSCTASNTVSVSQPPQLSINVNQVNVACYGQSSASITLNISGGTPAYTFNWNNNITSQNLINIDTGNYSVTITDGNLCTATAAAIITQPSPLSASAAITNAVCFSAANGDINMAVTGGTGGYTYSWSNNTNAQNLVNVIAGQYQVTVYDANLCSVTSSLNISQPPGIDVTAVTSNVTCFGGNNGAITTTTSGGAGNYTYLWNTGAVTANIDTLIAATYTVSVKDSANCSNSFSFDISQSLPMVINATTGEQSSGNVPCDSVNNGSILLNVTGGDSSYSYSWNNGDTSVQINNLIPNTYSVTVTDGNSCTATINATIIQPALLALNATHTDYECTNSTGTINLAVNGGISPYSFNWNGGISTQNRANLTAGNYTVTVTDAGACTVTASVAIAQIPVLTTNITKIDVTCFGGNNGEAKLDINNGTPPYTTLWNNGDNTKDISNLVAAGYTVNVTDANSCNILDSTVINQPQQMQLSETVKPASCNGISDGALSATVTGGTPPYVFNWSNNSTSPNITNLAAGTYAFTISDSNQCVSSATNIVISQPSAITAATNATAAGCSGQANGSIQLNVNGGTSPYAFLWSDQANTQNLSGLVAGNYTVTVTDSKSCTVVTDAEVALSSSLNITSSTHNASCVEVQNGSIELSVEGGTPAYNYNWSNGSHLQSLNNLAAGPYIVTITDANNCSQETEFTVLADYELQIQVSASASSNIIAGQSVQLTVTANVDHENTYAWNPSSNMSCGTCTTTDLVAEQTGTYTVSVVDANGCKAIDTITLNVNGHSDFYIPNAFSPNNDGNNDEFKIYGNYEAIVRTQFAIFDRWGEEVFETNDAQTAWNGSYKGEPAPMGVYVYMITLNLADGSVKNYKGSVTLIK